MAFLENNVEPNPSDEATSLLSRIHTFSSTFSVNVLLNLCKKATLKKTENWFSIPIIA